MWETKDAGGQHTSFGRKKVTRTTASRMCSLALHPGLYRTDSVGDLGSVREFAEVLGVSKRVPELADRVRMAISDPFVKRTRRTFAPLPAYAPEAKVSLCLHGLTSMIANVLGVSADPDPEVSVVVGGFLAQNNLAVIGRSDILYRAEADWPVVLTVEAKSENSFPAEQLWHYKSRGAQLYGALLASVVESSNPTTHEEGVKGVKRVTSTGLLVTRDRSKLIVLRPRAAVDGRSSMTVHTFSCGTSCLFNDSDTFLELIAICLLCDEVQQPESTTPNARLRTEICDAAKIPTAPRSANCPEMRESAQGTVRFQGFGDSPADENLNGSPPMDLDIVIDVDTLRVWSVGLDTSDLSNISSSTSFCDDTYAYEGTFI